MASLPTSVLLALLFATAALATSGSGDMSCAVGECDSDEIATSMFQRSVAAHAFDAEKTTSKKHHKESHDQSSDKDRAQKQDRAQRGSRTSLITEECRTCTPKRTDSPCHDYQCSWSGTSYGTADCYGFRDMDDGPFVSFPLSHHSRGVMMTNSCTGFDDGSCVATISSASVYPTASYSIVGGLTTIGNDYGAYCQAYQAAQDITLEYKIVQPGGANYQTKVIACVSEVAIDPDCTNYCISDTAIKDCLGTAGSRFNAESDEWLDEAAGVTPLRSGSIFVACGRFVDQSYTDTSRLVTDGLDMKEGCKSGFTRRATFAINELKWKPGLTEEQFPNIMAAL